MNLNLSPVIKDPLLNLQILAKRVDVDFVPFSPSSINKLKSLPSEVQTAIQEGLEEWLKIMSIVEPIRPGIETELRFLAAAEKNLGLRVPDDFKNLIKVNDIIEIYDFKNERQIYRNMEFFKYSTYDFLTMATNPWEDVFDRSERHSELIKNRSTEVTLSSKTVQPWNIEEHYLKEKVSPKQNVFKMKMGYLSPVYDTETGERRAWASTLQVEALGPGFDEENVLYL